MKKVLLVLSLSISIAVLCSCNRPDTAVTDVETVATAVSSEDTTEETETTTETTEETTEETTTETTEESSVSVMTEEFFTLPSEVEEGMSEQDKSIILMNMHEADPDTFETQEIKDYINENIYNANLLFVRIEPNSDYGIVEGVATASMYDGNNVDLHYLIKFDSVECAMYYFDVDGAAASGINLVFEEQEDGNITMKVDEKGFKISATISPDGLLRYDYAAKEQ